MDAVSLLHGQEVDAFADAGYEGAAKRADAKADVRCTSPCARVTAQLKEDHPVEVLIDELERVKAGIRAKVEALHGDQAPVRPCKDALPWPQKTQPQLFTLLALSNLWMERSKLLGEQG